MNYKKLIKKLIKKLNFTGVPIMIDVCVNWLGLNFDIFAKTFFYDIWGFYFNY